MVRHHSSREHENCCLLWRPRRLLSLRGITAITEHWHNQTKEQTLAALNTSAEGLSEAEATQRIDKYGLNKLPVEKNKSSFIRFISHFHNILIYVLIGCASITALLGHIIDTVVISAVVVINAIIGFLQEGKAEKAMDAIRNMLALRASVVRDSLRQTIEADQLVPGDIVILEAGDKVPADIRLIKTHSLQIQESILTGESAPIDKKVTQVSENALIGDRFCMAFSGTTITSGKGTGVVVATGDQTEIGRISDLLSDVHTLSTPLVEQMSSFAKFLTTFILSVAILLLIIGFFALNREFSDLFMAVVGLSVAAIPEGLPAVLTITLALGVEVMARRNAIVRRLPAIETLGAVSVICSDKTGTLTRNEMSVTSIISGDKLYTVEGTGYEPRGNIFLNKQCISPVDHPNIQTLGHAAALCNDSQLTRKNNSWVAEGDPMEAALLSFSGKTDINPTALKTKWTRTDLIPFDTKHKFMATLNHNHENDAIIFVKGAPEVVLSMCDQQFTDNNQMQALKVNFWHEQINEIAKKGQRTLAFATKQVDPQHTVLENTDVESGMIFIGLVGFIDPPRPEAIAAISECQKAGIEVKMITGDHAVTAISIGEQIGLANSANTLTGADLDNISDAELKEAVKDVGIFARTSPEHKLRLVMALQANGMTVAMTGDGVNDAPALKRANVGIAMGKTGSEAAKEASEIVLADDNFSSIVAAVREGRTVYDNIKKVISWTLPTNAGEAFTIILALLLGLSLPITPIQILWINMITAVTLGIALAFEATEKNTMQRPPRQKNESLLNGGLVWHILLVASLFLLGVFGAYDYAIDQGYSENHARTISLNTLVALEIFHLFFIRNMYQESFDWKSLRGTPIVWFSIIVVTISQIFITYVPWFQNIFATEPLSIADIGLVLGIGVTMFLIIETEKRIRIRLLRNN